MSIARIRLLLLAIFGVPFAFWLFLVVAYKVAVLPFLGTGEIAWWVFFTTSLITGGALIFAAAKPSRLAWLAAGSYLLVMALALGVVGFGTACAMGDCV